MHHNLMFDNFRTSDYNQKLTMKTNQIYHFIFEGCNQEAIK